MTRTQKFLVGLWASMLMLVIFAAQALPDLEGRCQEVPFQPDQDWQYEDGAWFSDFGDEVIGYGLTEDATIWNRRSCI